MMLTKKARPKPKTYFHYTKIVEFRNTEGYSVSY